MWDIGKDPLVNPEWLSTANFQKLKFNATYTMKLASQTSFRTARL
jgi:hypothetical protein